MHSLIGLAAAGWAILISAYPAMAQVPRLGGVQVLVQDDSAGTILVPASSLALPSQRPWQNSFYVSVAIEAPPDTPALEVDVLFDLRMGSQQTLPGDAENLDRRAIDRDGVWFRSRRGESTRIDCTESCPRTAKLGPFRLDELVPGPEGPDAVLWPTRMRIVAQAFASRSNQPQPPSNPAASVSEKEVPLR